MFSMSVENAVHIKLTYSSMNSWDYAMTLVLSGAQQGPPVGVLCWGGALHYVQVASVVLAARRLDWPVEGPEPGLKRLLKLSMEGASTVVLGRLFQSGMVRGMQENLKESVEQGTDLYLKGCRALVLLSAGVK